MSNIVKILFSTIFSFILVYSLVFATQVKTASTTKKTAVTKATKVAKKPVPKTIGVKLPPEIPINLKSVVVLRCLFKNEAGDIKKTFGSGVIIGEEGHILTARHVVDQDYTIITTKGKQGFPDYHLEHCEVGWPREGATAPTPQQIRLLNPFYVIDILPYIAKIHFVNEDNKNWSEIEKKYFDLAILQIAGLADDAKYFGITLPKKFGTSTLLGDITPQPKDEIISFGFPSGAPDYGGQFRLQGSVGQIKTILGGDKKFFNQPLSLESQMETIAGRSGSPVFWRGYVVGIISSRQDYSIKSFATSMVAFFKVLKEKESSAPPAGIEPALTP